MLQEWLFGSADSAMTGEFGDVIEVVVSPLALSEAGRLERRSRLAAHNCELESRASR